MGTGGSSSKKRSFSSANKKEKRSKNLSEVRRKKISKSRNRKNKTIKPRSHNDSISDSEEDCSYTTSRSDYECKKERAQAHTRRINRGKKKRSGKSSYSEESSHDSAVHYRKTKRLKKSGNADMKKKIIKKKRKRDLSVSSKGTVFRSCSPSFDKDKQEPNGEGDICDKKSEEIVAIEDHYDLVVNHPKRLKSIITFAEEDGMYRRELGNHVAEEMISFKHDIYPCKNGDSNNGGLKKDLNDFANEKHEDVKMIGSNANDLESVLRLKALENLRRFQGLRNCAKPKDKSDVKQVPSPSMTNVVKKPNEPPQEDIRISGADHISIPRINSSHFPLNDPQPVISGFDKQDSIPPPVDSINPKDLPCTKSSMKMSVQKKGESVVSKSKDAKGVDTSCISHSGKVGEGGNKEGSQYEQKTMSVMRGGKLVEVSYKVYIPKKGPGLGRRQLKR